MKEKALINIDIVLPDKIIRDGVLIFNKKIKKILSVDTINRNEYKIIDGNGGYLTPGLIDIHIHGAGGKDVMEATPESLKQISQTIVKSGVTSFLPTTMTMPEEKIKEALANVSKFMRKDPGGARVLGAHVEGPFINPDYKGAQKESDIQGFNVNLIKDYLSSIKSITVAPEMPGAEKFIKKMSAEGIVVSAGHTGASYSEINRARKWGLKHATHLFNGMLGIHHRQPGTAGAVLSSDLSCELIADFKHIHPAILKLVTEAKSAANIILITDSMQAAGLGPGEYSLGGQKVIVRDGEARLESGSLAGSVLTLDRAIRNMLNATNLSLNQIINMVTLNPARLLGLEHKLGKLEEGRSADLALFNDSLQLKKVYIRGERKV